jgi:RND family efflux transporter MFP subunit
MTMTRQPLAAPLIVLLPLLGLTSCADQSVSAPAPAAGRPSVAVTVATATASSLTDSVDVVGSLAPKFEVDVKSEVSGIVSAVYVNEWVSVARGARLARLDTSETEAGIEALRAMELQARTAETRARREYDRAIELRKFGLITPQNFDDAKSAVDAAEAATSAARAQVKTAEARLAKSFITAPMTGVVALRAVSVGDRVENMGGGPMFRIVDTRLLDLTVSVPSSRLALVRVGQPLEFTTDVLPGRTFTGKVMFINPSIDEASRSARVIAEVVNRDGTLKSGAFVKGRILVTTREGVLQVPREALLNWSLEAQSADVFVVNGDRAEKRAVKTGMTSGGLVEIVSGLAAGDRVVTRGGFALRPGDRVSVGTGEGA